MMLVAGGGRAQLRVPSNVRVNKSVRVIRVIPARAYDRTAYGRSVDGWSADEHPAHERRADGVVVLPEGRRAGGHRQEADGLKHQPGVRSRPINSHDTGRAEALPGGAAGWLQYGWRALRLKLGLSQADWRNITRRAESLGVPLQAELIASRAVSEEALVRALAELMEVQTVSSIRAERLMVTGEQCLQAIGRKAGLPVVTGMDDSGRYVFLLAPRHLDLDAFAKYLADHPEQRSRVCFVQSHALRQAFEQRGRKDAIRKALAGLKEALPVYSASTVLSGRQGVLLGAALAGGIACAANWPGQTLIAIHIIVSLVCFCCVVFKLLTASSSDGTPEIPLHGFKADEMPVYTVMVALYREAEVVPQLMTSLSRLVWPRSKLEIKLVCERDDHETLAAIRALELRDHVQVIEVPVSLPRTKPKALSYALPLSTGELIAVFDAEDRPNPYQLLEAWRTFRKGDDTLACVQAPLVITNGRGSWLARMFAFEYSALFGVVLPWLAKRQLVLPLGGTSNHFRRAALEDVGAWDPYNVTEDADLGIRLYRMGYNIGTISSATCEDAPTELAIWLRQRTRWFKGWIQTWLVHMRHPVRLFRDVGARSFFVIQILVPCALTAALSNVLMFIAVLGGAVWLAVTGTVPEIYETLLLLDVANIALGYAGFLVIGWRSLPVKDRARLWRYVVMTPFYWLLLSIAAWRAVWQLYRCPHYWEKTPHAPRKRAAGDAASQQSTRVPQPGL